MSIDVQRDTYVKSIYVNEKLSIEHDYPYFYSDQVNIHENIDFEFNVFCSFSGDVLS